MSRLKKRSVLRGGPDSRDPGEAAGDGVAGAAVARSAGRLRAGTPRLPTRQATRMKIRERSRILCSPLDGVVARGLHLTRGLADRSQGAMHAPDRMIAPS